MKYAVKYFYCEIELFRIYAEIMYVTLQHIHISIYSSTYMNHICLFSWVRKSYMWKNVRHIWRALVIYEISPFHIWNFIWHRPIWKLSRCIYYAYKKVIKMHIWCIYENYQAVYMRHICKINMLSHIWCIYNPFFMGSGKKPIKFVNFL